MHMFEVEVVFMVTLFIKVALCACNFNVISNGTMVQAPSTFDSALKPMIPDRKIRSANTEVRFNLIQIFIFRNTQPGAFFNTRSKNFYKIHCKASAVELRFWIVYCHAKFAK